MFEKLDNKLITLNVGGKKFQTKKSTLTKNPNTLLAKMFKPNSKLFHKTPEGEYFIDRSPEYFAPILNYLRVGKFVIDGSTSIQVCLDYRARF